uniref:Uncharacterized protein n=1 Tax=Megaviridae environmental sample TaxID=1737588 RepID=A0A5J6VJ80_9VIRU|nr:MAG: hypothetical protein [Megaviridae environmental sample]
MKVSILDEINAQVFTEILNKDNISLSLIRRKFKCNPMIYLLTSGEREKLIYGYCIYIVKNDTVRIICVICDSKFFNIFFAQLEENWKKYHEVNFILYSESKLEPFIQKQYKIQNFNWVEKTIHMYKKFERNPRLVYN